MIHMKYQALVSLKKKINNNNKKKIQNVLCCSCDGQCLALWVEFSAYDSLKYFSYFSQKIGFSSFCNGDNLHEKPNPVFGKNKKK